MSKVSSTKMVKDLKHLETRWTTYYNRFPYNCGYIWPAGFLSFDCIGLIKSYLNDPRIAYKKKPKGSWIQPGQTVPDGYGIVQMMKVCTKRSKDFSKVPACSLLMYEDLDHGGVFVGEYRDPSGIVNTIECCNDPVGCGVMTSYTDANGYRWDHKGGICLGRWVQHGLMTKWVSYPKVDAPKKK